MNEYEKELRQFDDNLIKPTAVAPLVTITSIVIAVSFIFGKTFATIPWVIWSTVASLMLFVITNFIPSLQFTKLHKTYITLYHIALMWVVVAIMPILSPFLMFWVVLTYTAQYYFKALGLYLSILVLGLTIAAGMYVQDVALTQDNLMLAGMWFLLVLAASWVFGSINKGALRNRGLLASKMIRAEYEHERILSLINGMSDAVIATDEKGLINIYNASAMELLNTNMGLDNQNVDDVMRLSDINRQPVRIIEYSKALRNNVAKIELYLDLSSDDRRTLEINISRTMLFSTLNEQKGYTYVMRDITEEKSLRQERDDFVSVVSHELRTPIAVAEANTAMAQLQAKKAGTKQADIDKSLDNAHRQILFLSEMINDLATLSRAETAKNKIEVEKFSIDEILNELDVIFRPKANAKNIDLTIKTEPGLSEMKTSKLYVKDILNNLISNAIKYTLEGGVTVTAKSAPENRIIFAIKDTGIGLSKAEQGKLFQKFWRSEDIHTRETEGTGLGLYIADKLARELGAHIKVESEKGKGSTFYVDMPTEASPGDSRREVIEKEKPTVSINN